MQGEGVRMTDATTYADVRVVLDHPVTVVWPSVAAFGELDRWAAGVTGCSVEGEGPGAIRTISLGDRQSRERLEAIDPAVHRLRYHILPPHTMPAQNIYSEIDLTALDGDRTEMRWRSEATDFDAPLQQVGMVIEGFYRRSIEKLDQLLRGD
jgi:hypothetical protein